MREYFVPEMYLKEREIRKIELGLKDTEELKGLFENKESAWSDRHNYQTDHQSV